MYNIRYHLVSLVAVFLALVVGLLLGSIAAERGYLDEQQAALVDSLRQEFDDLRQENHDIRTMYETDHAFVAEVVEGAIAGSLEGMRVAVVVGPDDAELAAAVNGTLDEAGAEVVNVVVRDARLGLDDAEFASTLAGLLGRPFDPADTGSLDRVAAALASELASPAVTGDAVLRAAADTGVLDLDGWDGSVGVDAAVVSVRFDGVASDVGQALATALAEAGARVCAAELSADDSGIAQRAQQAGISAVDHADLPQGALSLAMVLAGRAEGYYGTGDGAGAVNPPLSQSPEP